MKKFFRCCELVVETFRGFKASKRGFMHNKKVLNKIKRFSGGFKKL